MQGHVLEMWVIYDHPSDYPDKFVARLRRVSGLMGPLAKDEQTNFCYIGDTQKEVEDLLPAGLTFLPRFEGDDPVILGVWL